MGADVVAVGRLPAETGTGLHPQGREHLGVDPAGLGEAVAALPVPGRDPTSGDDDRKAIKPKNKKGTPAVPGFAN